MCVCWLRYLAQWFSTPVLKLRHCTGFCSNQVLQTQIIEFLKAERWILTLLRAHRLTFYSLQKGTVKMKFRLSSSLVVTVRQTEKEVLCQGKEEKQKNKRKIAQLRDPRLEQKPTDVAVMLSTLTGHVNVGSNRWWSVARGNAEANNTISLL